jgi:hypothetical protein
MYRRGTGVVAAVTAVVLAAGCGGGDDGHAAPQVTEGAVVYRDALDSNAGKWLVAPGKAFFSGRAYVWNDVPPSCANALPDAELRSKLPDGVATSVDVRMRDGAALRGVTCRESGVEERNAWYELGIDGRRALVRRLKRGAPPKVLASAEAPVENGRNVRLTGRCVPDGDGLSLGVLVDGRQVASARDDDPVEGAPSTIAVFAYKRPDSKGPANLTWNDFAIRSATVGR